MINTAVHNLTTNHPYTRRAVREALQFLMSSPTPAGTEDSRRSTPPFPSTASQAADMQSAAQAALHAGQVYKATPLLCMLALRSMLVNGPEHADTVHAVHAVLANKWHMGYRMIQDEYHWLLPRAAVLLGYASPELRSLVQQATYQLAQMRDPREQPEFHRVVADVAMQLQGGLGWGLAKVAPLADEEAYNRHAVLQQKGLDVMFQGNMVLARRMFERCVAYYETIGPHWLVSPRLAKCLKLIALCVEKESGVRAAESYAAEARHTAQQHLGSGHENTLNNNWYYGELLRRMGRKEKALKIYQATLQQRIAAHGPETPRVFQWLVSDQPPDMSGDISQ